MPEFKVYYTETGYRDVVYTITAEDAEEAEELVDEMTDEECVPVFGDWKGHELECDGHIEEVK